MLKRMSMRRKWWSYGMRAVTTCGLCCCRRGQDGGHLHGLWVGDRWLQGPGRNPVARRADLGGSGLWGRRQVALFTVGFGWAGFLQFARVCRSASGGGNSSRGLHSGVGGDGPRVTGLCLGGVCG